MANAADAYVLAAKLLSMANEMADLRIRLVEAERVIAYYADLKNHQGERSTGHVPIVDDDECGNMARNFLSASNRETRNGDV